MSEEQTLIERLEKATEPDREMDAEIACAVEPGEIRWKQANYTMESIVYIRRARSYAVGGFASEFVPQYTSSLDAAMTLIEPGCEISMTNLYGVAAVEVGLNHNYGFEVARREDGNLVLALVTAALKFKARATP